MLFERLVALRYLRSSKQEGFISVITGFSFLGIALGVATLIIVMSVMNGFRQELLSRIIGMRGHLMIHDEHYALVNYEDIVCKVQNLPGIESVYPLIEKQAVVTYHNQARGAGIQGISKKDLKKRSLIAHNIKAGSLEDFEADDTIIIGKRMADIMYLQIGDRVTLVSPEGNTTAFGTVPRQKSFKIIAIFEIGMREYDKSVIFIPLQTAQTFFKLPHMVTNLEVFIDQPDLASKMAQNVQKLLGDKARVLDWQHGDSSYFQAVQIERNVMFIILTLLILIAAFNIITSLIMLVKDKTRDIAILRTMGASSLSIMKIFFINGASIGVVGTFLGVILGLSITSHIEKIRQIVQSLCGTELFQPEVYFLTQLPSKVDPHEVISVVLMALGLSFLATLYPSWRAAKLDPVEALRL